MFTILSIRERDYQSQFFTEVTVSMPVKTWAKAKRLGRLGTLYGDISNHLYREHNVLDAWCPTVDSSKRAKLGVKTVTLVYAKRLEMRPKLKLIQGGLQ